MLEHRKVYIPLLAPQTFHYNMNDPYNWSTARTARYSRPDYVYPSQATQPDYQARVDEDWIAYQKLTIEGELLADFNYGYDWNVLRVTRLSKFGELLRPYQRLWSVEDDDAWSVTLDLNDVLNLLDVRQKLIVLGGDVLSSQRIIIQRRDYSKWLEIYKLPEDYTPSDERSLQQRAPDIYKDISSSNIRRNLTSSGRLYKALTWKEQKGIRVYAEVTVKKTVTLSPISRKPWWRPSWTNI